MSLSKKSQVLILDLINNSNPQFTEKLTFDVVEFADPTVHAEDERNTSVVVGSLEDSPYAGDATVVYDRLDLQKLFTDAGYPVVEIKGVGLATSLDLLPYLNDTFSLALDEDDIVSEALPAGDVYPKAYTLKVKPTSFAWLNELSISLIDGKPQLSDIIVVTVLDGLKYPTGDVSDLIRPVVKFNVPAAAIFAEEGDTAVLLGGGANTNFISANNAELEIDLRVEFNNAPVVPVDGPIPTATLDDSESGNGWAVTALSGLLDIDKGAEVIDLYRISLSLESTATSTTKRLQLVETAGVLAWHFVEADGSVGVKYIDAITHLDGRVTMQRLDPVTIFGDGPDSLYGLVHLRLEARRLDSIAPRLLAQIDLTATGPADEGQ